MMRDIGRALEELHTELHRLYGVRLKGVYLFGSHARGDPGPESDVDVLIVLDEVAGYGAEVARTSNVVGGLSLRHGIAISRVFVSEADWHRGASNFLAHVREEAIAA
jgi:predicted nucleotidyltransferase